ncbi:TPA: acyltransferase [Acinetobacter baumannii]|uniref:acyltransferase family protein n=1 Tax=Acinetobacter baumannii TaxID=470 RepID=UPI002741B6F6|nr:acyltransferase [Acinetobacter baumannii]MDP7927848.1 acyltransferase [Acinetobacter baumannii]HCD9551699.1 acyltransferase [Acinetobacter baumannii]HCD9566576.1 acyltransferase [Acinetobacter baumannii]HCD9608993.1 acyltransferase [Acinetobacter baumannii]HCD9631998.1 acyltransferase [Acinetobacter baumannii]
MINNIQALRAFAALNVVFYHIIGASITYGISANGFHFLKEWGQNGVDIFFVISGFIMVFIQEKNRKSSFEFIKNRVERIVPVYWLLTLAYLSLAFIIPSAFNSINISSSKIIYSFLFIEDWMSKEMPLLYVGWTLEYEMLFYIIFALSLFIKNKIFSYLTMGVALVLLPLVTSLDLIILEFAFGMLCAFVFLRLKPKNGLLIAGFGFLLLCSSILFDYELHRSVKWGVPAFFIVLGLLWMNQTKNKIAIYLGNASYSIYLIQVFTIPLFYKISSKYLTFLDGHIIALLALIFSAIVGCLFYQIVEVRVTNFIKSRKSNSLMKNSAPA